MSVVPDQLQIEPDSKRALYLFCGKRRDRIIVLIKEPNGWVLLYKRLDRYSGRYSWPKNKNEVKPITWKQFNWLMSGLDIEQPKEISNS